MPAFTTRKVVPHAPRQMFDLVADVERYPEFVPLCERMRVMSRTTEGDATTVVATMTVGHRLIRESFTSRVVLRPAESRIDVSYVDGPFRRMNNRWLFKPAPGGAEVEFHIDYELRSAMLAMLVGALFDTAFRKFVTAFEARAARIYPSGTAAGGLRPA